MIIDIDCHFSSYFSFLFNMFCLQNISTIPSVQKSPSIERRRKDSYHGKFKISLLKKLKLNLCIFVNNRMLPAHCTLNDRNQVVENAPGKVEGESCWIGERSESRPRSGRGKKESGDGKIKKVQEYHRNPKLNFLLLVFCNWNIADYERSQFYWY